MKGKNAIIALTLILSISLLFCSCNKNLNPVESNDLINIYLQQNYSVIDVNDKNLDSLSLLLNDSKESEVILTGECHAVQKNFAIKLAILKYLHQNADVRYLLCESGYASTRIYNDYIQTGDKSSLDLVYKELKQTSSYTKESYDFWVQLFEYNKTLAKDDKIIAIGVDIEHHKVTAINYLLSIKGKGLLSTEHVNMLNTIKEIININDKKEKLAIAERLKQYIESNEQNFMDNYGDSYFDFKLTLDGIYNSCLYYAENNIEAREQAIYNNFTKIHEHYPKKKYFGQWGAEHIYQHNCGTYMKDCDRFAIRLNYDDSPVKDKVLSIQYAYKDCMRLNMQNGGKEFKIASYINDSNFLFSYTNSDYTLFKLNGENTPFNNLDTFIIEPYGGSTLDYYQYILVINDSAGATKFE